MSENSLEKLNKIEGLKCIVSITWHCKWKGYLGSYKNSFQQGQQFSSFFMNLIEKTAGQDFVLCHSMGSHLFEGIISNHKKPITTELFNTVFIAGSDAPYDAFEQHFQKLPTFSKDIVVFTHYKDVLFKLSKMVHRKSRLGIIPKDYKTKIQPNHSIEFIDITNEKTGKLSFLNHIYFKKSPNVLHKMQEFVVSSK